MKKSKTLIIIHALVSICIAITLFIVYMDMDHPFAYKFVIGSIIFLLLFACYLMFRTILNIRNLKWIEIRKRFKMFIGTFILSCAFIFVTDYIFRPSKVDVLRIVYSSFVSALGISFLDLGFLRKKNEIE